MNSSFIVSLFFPKVARDPRFDDLSGEYNAEVFDKTYQFLNDIRAKEKEVWNIRPAHGDSRGGKLGYRLLSWAEGNREHSGGQIYFSLIDLTLPKCASIQILAH